MTFHLLFDFEVFVCKGFPDLLCLEGKYALERFLLGSEHLDLFLVIVELLSERFDHLLEGAYFTLNVGGVLYLRARSGSLSERVSSTGTTTEVGLLLSSKVISTLCTVKFCSLQKFNCS